MKLITNKGEFDSFQELRLAYLQSGEHVHLDPGHAEADEWDDKLLHASEVGYCARMQMLRIAGAEKKPQANLTIANEQVMFWVANRLHWLTFEAMQWAGILVACEMALMEPPWAGRCDALLRPDVNAAPIVLYDLKTVRPNAMKYSESFPKDEHCLQLGAYASKADVRVGVVEYLDRGGSNAPIECVVALDTWRERAEARMDDLEYALEHYYETDALPPVLPESFVAHYVKRRGQPYKDLTSVTYDCSWQCSYCSYHHSSTEGVTLSSSPCKPPNHAPILAAKKVKGAWTYPEKVAGLEEFLAAQVMTVPLIGGQEDD